MLIACLSVTCYCYRVSVGFYHFIFRDTSLSYLLHKLVLGFNVLFGPSQTNNGKFQQKLIDCYHKRTCPVYERTLDWLDGSPWLNWSSFKESMQVPDKSWYKYYKTKCLVLSALRNKKPNLPWQGLSSATGDRHTFPVHWNTEIKKIVRMLLMCLND